MSMFMARRWQEFHTLLAMARRLQYARMRPDDRRVAGLRTGQRGVRDRLDWVDDRQPPSPSH
jgi:hypothetical protein